MKFESWYAELLENQSWYEVMQMQHKGKDFDAAARRVYADAIADPVAFEYKPMGEHRKHIANILRGMPVTQQVYKAPEPKVEEKKEQSAPPLTGEARQAKIREWLNTLRNTETKRVPRLTYQEIMEEGDWLPKPKEKYIPVIKDEAVLRLQEAIRKAGQEYYRNQVIGVGFEIFVIDGFDVYAKSKEDAEQIYLNAI